VAIRGFNLDQTRQFELDVNSLRDKIETDSEFKNKLLDNGTEYENIKNYFEDVARYLQYPTEVQIEHFYRVRKLDNEIPFTAREELIYPKANKKHEDRMNNISFRVLYVSLHEFTAMAETRINESYIGNYFQLTKFTTTQDFKVYKLGMFSELHFNAPRDSEYVKGEMEKHFGNPNHNSTVQGYSALECAIADVLYDQRDGYHILSSIMADAIFSVNPTIDAIIYPSLQNKYGINLAIRKNFSDKLKISYTAVKQLDDVYGNGFFKYRTIQDCLNEDNLDEFILSKVEGTCRYR
jgi:hypothetical protein